MVHLTMYENPEPVPPVSQLCALPFVATVAGYLNSLPKVGAVRVTLHRVMTRDGAAYLQQICSYAGSTFDHGLAGRLFPVTEGIIGKAFAERGTFRTKCYETEDLWRTDYRLDRADVGENGEEPAQAKSYLAVPFLNAAGDTAVCILYADVVGLGVFAAGDTLQIILGLSNGFCSLLDDLSKAPLPRIRNYPLPEGKPVTGSKTVYRRLQERVQNVESPRFQSLTSFNFAPAP
jgi:hypothetical protein